jgi:hypothetical protein
MTPTSFFIIGGITFLIIVAAIVLYATESPITEKEKAFDELAEAIQESIKLGHPFTERVQKAIKKWNNCTKQDHEH